MENRNTVEIILSAKDNASEALRHAFGSVEESHNKFLGAIMSSKALIAGAFAAVGGAIAKTGVEYDAMMEQSTVAWTTLLGNQKEAKQMMNDLANFAKTTPFQTQDLDMMAKYLHNAGLEGKTLFVELGKISDVSSAFNISADNAKIMTMEMSHVMQSGRAYARDLNELQNKGVPIYKAIGQEMHITTGEVKKMGEKGQITSDIYLKAFDSIAGKVKGASAAQSQTMNGLLTTLKDDWLMVTGILAKPLFDVLKQGINAVIPLMDALTAGLKGDANGVNEALTKAFGADTTKQINNFISGFKEGFANGFGEMQTKTGTFGAFIGSTFYTIQSTIKTVVGVIKPTIQALFDFLMGKNIDAVIILTKLGFSPQLILEIQKVIGGIKTAVSTFVADYIKFIQNLFSGKNNIANSFMSMFNTVKSIAMPILQDIVKFIGSQFEQIKLFWDKYGGQITQAVQNFFMVLAAIFKVLAPVLLFIIMSVWDNIKGIFEGAVKIIEGIILVFTGIFTGHWNTLWEGIKDILGGAVEVIWNVINLLFIAKILKGIGGFFELIKGVFSGGWDWIIGGIKGFVANMGDQLATFVDVGKSKFGDLIDAAKNIPKGIANGIQDGIHWVTDGIMGLANELLKQFKKALGINSPSKVFYEMGGHILDGLVNGLSSGNLLDLGKMVFSDFGGGIMNTVDKIKGFLTGAFGGGGGGNADGWIQSALSIVGAPPSWLGPLSQLVQHESGGDPRAINNWDSNAKAGHPSKGLFQTIDSTFNSFALPGLGDIYNPIANAVAGIRYIMSRYGSVFNVPGIKGLMNGSGYVGYASGTNDAPGGWAMIGENGPEMMYVPKGSQIKSNAETNKLLNGGNHKTYNVTVNTLKADMNENDLVRALQRMERLNFG